MDHDLSSITTSAPVPQERRHSNLSENVPAMDFDTLARSLQVLERGDNSGLPMSGLQPEIFPPLNFEFDLPSFPQTGIWPTQRPHQSSGSSDMQGMLNSMFGGSVGQGQTSSPTMLEPTMMDTDGIDYAQSFLSQLGSTSQFSQTSINPAISNFFNAMPSSSIASSSNPFAVSQFASQQSEMPSALAALFQDPNHFPNFSFTPTLSTPPVVAPTTAAVSVPATSSSTRSPSRKSSSSVLSTAPTTTLSFRTPSSLPQRRSSSSNEQPPIQLQQLPTSTSIPPPPPPPPPPLPAPPLIFRTKRSSTPTMKIVNATPPRPRIAPTWARQAAARASTRRKTHEEPVHCSSCQERIAVVYLRGTQKAFENGYAVDILCEQCVQSGGVTNVMSAVSASSSTNTRKRNRETPSVDCEVCKRHLGSGGVRKRPISPVANPIPLNQTASSSQHSASSSPSNSNTLWEEPEFGIEFICTSCADKYLFCSECGGGGRNRTGKWRPKELFEKGRKTCSLPHIRIGDATVNYRVLEVPRELTDVVLRGLQDVFFDMALSLYAIPALIELRKYDGQFENVRREIEKQWTETVVDVVHRDNDDEGQSSSGGDATSPTTTGSPSGPGRVYGKKKYLTVAWINKIQRNKGKTSRSSMQFTPSATPPASALNAAGGVNRGENVPWLVRLALEGTVAPRRALRDEEVVLTPGEDPVEDRVYVGFCITEWDREHNTLFMIQIAPRSVYLPTMESYGELLRRAVERIQADARHDGLAPLSHIWCWTRTLDAEHTRIGSIPERLGFIPRDKYVENEHPELRSVSDRAFSGGYDFLKDPKGVMVYVCSVKKFMSSGGSKNNSSVKRRR
ncbi:hypothetical protein BJ742DRAFT_810760 [Cladochytrium replicatum]|nr:hypothetical protein BJ742DRAFT_810760 [Cladochytrium replicatum]